MPVAYMLTRFWQWIADQGLSLALLLVIALLVPRVGRFAQRWINRGVEETGDEDESKTRLVVAGVSVYIAQMIVFFLLLVFFLQVMGFSLAGAAIPATVASAAVGFGAQSIIADFLAGFFILTEKQFGVGDWVRFQGNGIEVEGTVIQVTMRATRIRTLAEETVIIPNSTARVCINSSNYWSRAVVVMPVPLLGSRSPQETIERSEAATRRALRREDVARQLLGELDVHPAVGINPPSTVGMPWTVNMRFMVQVKAGSQWLVERAIRTSILEEFWDEYGSATTITGEVRETVIATSLDATKLLDAPRTPSPHESTSDERSRVPDTFPADHDPAVDDGEVKEEKESNVFRSEEFNSGWKRFASLGGRVRPSTSYLFVALFVLLILKGLTLETAASWDGNSGVLAPPRETPVTTSEVVPTEPTYSPEPTYTQSPTPTPTLSDTPTPTPTGVTPTPEATPAETPTPAATPEIEPTPTLN